MVRSPLTGVVDEVVAPEGAHVAAGATVLVVESMKMHHEVHAPRADLAAVLARRRAILDEGRPEAVARRHATGRRTARENVGGRPGDTDQSELFHLMVPTFAAFARLSALVPRIGIVAGPCFAGNAALVGCCDVIVATPDASIGMGGPAMIAGGGLGRFAPEEVGPVEVQAPNGVIDLLVDDEAQAVAAARALIGLLAGDPAPAPARQAADQAALRDLVPEDPKRIHDVRAVLDVLADPGSVVELRRAYGRGMLTALARLGGRPIGVLGNDPAHLSGAVDAEGSDKAARFLQLCDAFGLPVVALVDTPGFMVGPGELEAIAGDAAHEARVQELMAAVRAQSGALSMADVFEIDDVIDPADTRGRLLDALRAVPPQPPPPGGRRRTMVDAW